MTTNLNRFTNNRGIARGSNQNTRNLVGKINGASKHRHGHVHKKVLFHYICLTDDLQVVEFKTVREMNASDLKIVRTAKWRLARQRGRAEQYIDKWKKKLSK